MKFVVLIYLKGEIVSRVLIIIGIGFVIAGIFVHFGLHRYIPLGRLPGDIMIRGENSRFYFPVTTSILISILLSVVAYLLRKFG